MDIARIGFAADTGGINKAVQALNQLPPAANKAEAAVMSIGGSFSYTSNQATKAANKVTAAANGMAAANQNSSKVIDLAAARNKRALDQWFKDQEKVRTSTQGLSHDAKNLTFQLNDVVGGLAMGQPPMQVFLQQAGQISQLMSAKGGLSGLFKELGQAVMSVVTPMRLLTVGFLGAAAGIAILAVNAINSTKEMDELAKSTGFAVKELHQLEQLTSAKGISKDDFAAGMKSFSEQAYQARHNLGDLNGLMIANGKTAKTNVQYFMQVADLVARTTDEVQKRKILEAASLPTTQKWVDLMSQGSKAIKLAADGTIQFNTSAEANLVRKAKEFDDAWNKAVTNISNYFKSGIISSLNAITSWQPPEWFSTALKVASTGVQLVFVPGQAVKKISNLINPKGDDFNDRFQSSTTNNGGLQDALNKKAGALRPADPKTQQQLLAENSQMQQRLSLLGEMATVEEKVKQKQLEINAAGLQGISVGKERIAQIINATRAQEEMNRVTQQAALGIFNLEAAQKAASATLQMWIDKKLVDKNNTEQLAAAQLVLKRNIDQVKDAAAVAAAPLQQLKQLELDAGNFGKQLDTTLTSSLNNLVSPIQDVVNGVTSLSDGFKNAGVIVLKAIQEMIIKMLILAPIAKGLQGIFGGLGGGGMPLNILPSAKGNVFVNDNVQPFAKGGIVNKPELFAFANGGKLGLRGEAGPEAIMPLKRGPGGGLGVQMFGGKSKDGGAMSLTYAPQYTLGGSATQDDIANLRKEKARDLAKLKGEFPKMVAEARKRGTA